MDERQMHTESFGVHEFADAVDDEQSGGEAKPGKRLSHVVNQKRVLSPV